MQKFWNIASPIIIIGLAIWIFFLIKANRQWKALIPPVVERIINDSPPVQNSAPDTTAPVNNSRTDMSGAQFWDEIKKGLSEMTVDLKFNNNQ